ncbi:MAG: hypothetical protein M0Z82_00195 [Actinomycetota bacterium]|nr:hypothetical protein [Actinomycetota bacterium]
MAPVTVATSGPSGDVHEVSALTERPLTDRAVIAASGEVREVPGGTGTTAGSAPPGAAGELLVPPDDPDDWSDDQWLAWLGQGDDDSEAAEPRAPRVQRSAGGQILGNAMLGLAEAMYGQKRPEIVVEADASGDPMGDDLQLYLDPEHPEDSVVFVRGSRRRGGPRPSPGAGP